MPKQTIHVSKQTDFISCNRIVVSTISAGINRRAKYRDDVRSGVVLISCHCYNPSAASLVIGARRLEILAWDSLFLIK
jgi:hypothetical protein